MAIRNKKGMWMDGKGDFVPVRYVPKLDKAKDKIVVKLAEKAIKLNAQMEKFKVEVMAEIDGYIRTAEEFYDVAEQTMVGNKSLTDFANTLRVELSVNKTLAFDEKLGIARVLIDDCIETWSEGANMKLVALVEQAFKTDKRGRIDRDRILGLRKLEIADEKWQKAMKIIGDSLTVVDKKSYIRFQKKTNGKWETISLDMAKI
ncbi:MAG: sulfate transporter [Bacteroidetes bacterium 4572_77]|nr:MAG: sulfate transporter [Bacteroidetes bacterium 4572_77]